MVIFRIIKESFLLAIRELVNNKLRASLSLLGITIGIICIISVFAAVDSLEKDIRGSFDILGDDVVNVEKWPWIFGGEYEWWKYMNRPEANYNDFKAIARNSEKAEAVAIQYAMVDRMIKFGNSNVSNAVIAGVTHDYNKVLDIRLEAGRYFSPKESETGDNVIVVGYEIADALFGSPESALGREIKAMGRKLVIIGVVEKEGESLISTNMDKTCFVPYNFLSSMINENSRIVGQRIMVKAAEGVAIQELMDELTIIMRKARRLKPKQESNFALNRVSLLSEGISQSFLTINLAGLFIGGFSILVGGFGIANIMFVSVKERTNIIGVKKALGAKKIFILLEFVIEAVVLCLIGGLVGLLFVLGLIMLLNELISFTFVLSTFNIVLGIFISVFIGLISGIFPAWTAAQMDPVEAIRK